MVRTAASQAVNTGSIPVGATKCYIRRMKNVVQLTLDSYQDLFSDFDEHWGSVSIFIETQIADL